MRSLGRQRGFTLVEALVAGFVLVVGALGTVAMVSTANQQTARNMGEESATALAREVTEVARQIPFAAVHDPGEAAAAIGPRVPGSGAVQGTSWSVERHNRAFAVTLDSCQVASAGQGGCTDPDLGSGTGVADADLAVLIDVLGLAGVDLSGGVPNALCGVFGPQFDLSVLNLAGVEATTCAQAGSQAALPSGGPRLARVTATVAWDNGAGPRQVAATALVVDPSTLAAPR